MTTQELKAAFESMIERLAEAGHPHEADIARLIENYFTDPAFRGELEDFTYSHRHSI